MSVEQTIEEDLPAGVRFLEAFDRFSQGMQEIDDMPTDRIELLRKSLARVGKVCRGAPAPREFAALSDEEGGRIEALFRHDFEGWS